MASVEAKAKVKERHKVAVAQFRKWRKMNPKATHEEQIKAFDFLVDTGKLQDMVDAA